MQKLVINSLKCRALSKGITTVICPIALLLLVYGANLYIN